MAKIPSTQYALQLTGPDEIVLNKSKATFKPGPHQILCKVEAAGLCFSDLKLLKQFSSHARKAPVISGIAPEVLKEIPSYVPGDIPTVPGHEAVVRIAEVGSDVIDFKTTGRYLVQTDYRWLGSATSNGTFGYTFEGALQEYVLMDERVITSPEGESMLIPASEELSASAVALVEPWACVEHAYRAAQRRTIKADGQMLVVADSQVDEKKLAYLIENYGRGARLTWFSPQGYAPPQLNIAVEVISDSSKLADAGFDDVIYFGSDANTVESLFCKIGSAGLLNIVLCGGSFQRDVTLPIGRVHYGGIRMVGNSGTEPAASMEYIPENGEIRSGDKINVIGAGGPMGVMHVIRDICQGVENITIFAGDTDQDRLDKLTKIASPLALKNCINYMPFNPAEGTASKDFDYIALMAPIPKLLAESLYTAAKGAVINIFAGIPVTVNAAINLNEYIEKQLFFIGTSGSVLDDMKQVLAKVQSHRLDTDISVAAVCGLDGAAEGIRAVENRSIAGKIIVYPQCKGLELTRLEDMKDKLPDVAQCLQDGCWNKQAEQSLLKMYSTK